VSISTGRAEVYTGAEPGLFAPAGTTVRELAAALAALPGDAVVVGVVAEAPGDLELLLTRPEDLAAVRRSVLDVSTCLDPWFDAATAAGMARFAPVETVAAR
jgi:hypothetical protein